MSRWPLRKAYFWEEAPLLRPLLALVSGILCYDYGLLPGLRLPQALVILSLSGGLLIAATFRKSRAWRVLYTASFTLLFATAGWCAFAVTDGTLRQEYFGRRADTSSVQLARIDEPPQVRATTTKCVLQLLCNTDSTGTKSRITGKALLYIYRSGKELQLAEGDTLLIPAKWLPVRNAGNPFERDNARFLRRQGLCYQQFVSPDDVVLFGKSSPAGLGYIAQMHGWCDRQLRAAIRDSATLGLLQAMLLGDESGFDPELRQAYSQTGVIHIVSISGSHVAVLFLVVTWALFWIRGRAGSRIRYLTGVSLVWLYVLIAGAPPSALRSAVMFTIIAFGVLSDREGHSLNTMLGAAFGLLVAEPAWLFSVGFQLSFGAVLSILLFYKPIYRIWPQRTKIGRIVVQAIAASLAAEVLTAPLVIYYFHNFPLLFIIANLLSAVMIGICALVGGMVIIALFWWPRAAAFIGMVVSFLVMLFNRAITFLQGLNPGSFAFLQISFAEMLLVYALIAACAYWWLRRARIGFLIALPTACLLLLLLCMDKWKALRQERLIVYSNGSHPLVEYFKGQSRATIIGDPDAYNAKAAHTGYGAWRPDKALHPSYFSYKGRRVFILSDTTLNNFTMTLPADILIIARPLRYLSIEKTLSAFHPAEIILAQKPAGSGFQRWKDSCAVHQVKLRNTAADGAVVL